MVFNKPWYSKQDFLHVYQTPLKNTMISFNTFYIKTLKTIYSQTPPEPVEVPLLQLSR
jgi:hypothetical protein